METLLLEPAPGIETIAQRDRERLQGTWNFVSGLREAQMLIAGDHFTIKFKNGEIFLGTLQLDPTTKPKTMKMQVSEGPRHQGQDSLAIYELDGEYLIWCPGLPGTGERPRTFPPNDDKQHLCIVFRREKKLSAGH